MLRRTTLCTLAVFAAGASAAHAGTIRAQGTTIYYDANPGEANFVTVNWGNVAAGPDSIASLDDHMDVNAPADGGCEYSISLGARCTGAGSDPHYVGRGQTRTT